MDFQNEINTLYKMRFMENEGDDIVIFEQLLNEIAVNSNVDIIPSLCTLLEDEVAEPSVSEYVIDTIFYIAKQRNTDKALEHVATSIPNMLMSAEFWVERIHQLILSNAEFTKAYAEILTNINPNITEVIKKNLVKLKEEPIDAIQIKQIELLLKNS
ncbi:Imm30 family immunity protein [Priestia megaterium]|uniref:Imm30 family immunity protein n=1 Tax=Priestia megaterium TaxID=1404 RepID=UPI003C94086A